MDNLTSKEAMPEAQLTPSKSESNVCADETDNEEIAQLSLSPDAKSESNVCADETNNKENARLSLSPDDEVQSNVSADQTNDDARLSLSSDNVDSESNAVADEINNDEPVQNARLSLSPDNVEEQSNPPADETHASRWSLSPDIEEQLDWSVQVQYNYEKYCQYDAAIQPVMINRWTITDSFEQPPASSDRVPLYTRSTSWRSKYGKILYNICDPNSDIKNLADTFMSTYKSDKLTDEYSNNERVKLSDFYFDCESFQPDESETWKSKYSEMSTDSNTLRKRATELLMRDNK
jgi:hypothetical protein